MKLKRKIKRKWESVGTNQKMMFVFVSLLFFITVGYAAINQVLKIAGYASIDKGDGMIYTSLGINENNGATIEKDASIKAKTLVNTQVSFQSAGSITFNVSAQNQGTTDAKLIEIKGLEESNIKEPSCIQVSVQEHNVGDLVYPNQVKNFTITITSTCSTYSSKELDLHFVYEKQETINGQLPYDTLGTVTTDLLNNSGDGTYNYMDGTYLKGTNKSTKDNFYEMMLYVASFDSIESINKKFFDENGVFMPDAFEEWGFSEMGITEEQLESMGVDTVFEALFQMTSEEFFNQKVNVLNNNYVWFDGFMWRIMGKNADGSVRMITEENVTSIPWGTLYGAQDYDNSYVNDWLNDYFYSQLERKDLLVNQIWCSETTTDATSVRTMCTNNLSNVQSPVGLLSLDEYNLASGSSSYLNTSQLFWTLTPYDTTNAWIAFTNGSAGSNLVVTAYGVRPVINVNPDIVITGGSGILTEPYTIEEIENVTGNLKDNSHAGEYVTYAGRNYRVVETSSSGTKLILDGYYDSNNDGIVEDSDYMAYGTNCTLCTAINEESFINWISNNNEIDKNKLVSTTWYRGDYFDGDDNYKDNLESTSNPYEGRVGLIRVGEMLSGQSETILSENHSVNNFYGRMQNYWTSTPSVTPSSAWYTSSVGGSGYTNVTNTQAVRPVIMIHPGVPITGGQGTPNEPYQLGEVPTATEYLINNKVSSDINTSPTNGLFAIDNQGELTTSTSPREYRYIGANPDNYIQFNNELWRIIGIFDGQLKIIRSQSLGNMEWDTNSTNNWSTASLQTYLNNDYYGMIASKDQAKIDSNYVWKLGGSSSWDNVTTQMFYESERGTEVYEGRPTEWTGSIGLMYPSDYGFSTSGGSTTNRSSCLATVSYGWNDSDGEDCRNNSWLYDSSSNQWTLAPFASYSYPVFHTTNGGFVYFSIASISYAVRPTLYLQPTVEIASGTGTSSDPYILK